MKETASEWGGMTTGTPEWELGPQCHHCVPSQVSILAEPLGDSVVPQAVTEAKSWSSHETTHTSGLGALCQEQDALGWKGCLLQKANFHLRGSNFNLWGHTL